MNLRFSCIMSWIIRIECDMSSKIHHVFGVSLEQQFKKKIQVFVSFFTTDNRVFFLVHIAER